MLEAIKKNGKISILRFINNTSCFRLTLFAILFFYIPSQIFAVWAVMFFWSVYLFYTKMIKQRYLQKVHFRKIMYLFLMCGLVTVLLHSEQNLFMNFYMLYWVALCFFSAYSLHSEKSHSKNKKEMMFLLDFITKTTTLIMLVGLCLLAIFPKGIKIWGYNFAIYENRFIGILTNANVLAFYAVMAVICCHILWKTNKSVNKLTTIKKILYIFCGTINIISMFLSDSNAALLFIITYLCFIAFYGIFNNFKHSGVLNFTFRLIATILACTVIISVILIVRTVTQSTVSLIMTVGQSHTEISNGILTDNNGSVHIKDDIKDENNNRRKTTPSASATPTFEHENTNIDSGRFAIWKQAAGLFEKFPLMGIGQANIVSYGEKYLGGLKYTDFHNGLLTILISFGLVGFNIFIVFAITVAKTMLKAVFICNDKCHKDGDILALIIAFCAGYCVYSMFEVVLLMRVEYRVFIFWIMIGYGLSYAFRYEKEKRKEMSNIRNYTFAELPAYSNVSENVSVFLNKTADKKKNIQKHRT